MLNTFRCCSLDFIFIVTFSSIANTLANPPHIVFIIADDLGYHDVGYHGADIKTPNIDQLAKDGVILENYYVQPICTPSRSQLMTGRYQIHFGLQHSVLFGPQPHCVPVDEVFLPQKLKEVGYATHAVGKWHLGFCKKECLPTSRGFDTHYGYYCGAEDYYTKQVSGAAGHGTYKYKGFDFHENAVPKFEAAGTYSTFLYEQKATEIIKSHNASDPLFLYMAFQAVHFPLEAPQRYIDMYSHITDKNRRVFSGMVTAMDDAIGSIISALKSRSMWEDTLVVFTTDNGGQTLLGGNNFPLRGRKASLWEGGVRGVGLIHGAGIENPSRTSYELMHVSDWFPTLISVAGGTTSGTKPLDSHNVWKAISQTDSSSPRTEILHNIDPVFSRAYAPNPPLIPFPNSHGVDTLHGHTALRMQNWKLYTGDPGYDKWDPVPTIYRNQTFNPDCLTAEGYVPDCVPGETIAEDPVPSLRLFDVLADPEERNDVASFFPGVVDVMLTKIAAYNKTAVPYSFPDGDMRCNPQLQGDAWGPWL